MNHVGEKLYRSIQSGSSTDNCWFEDALDIAMSRSMGLDQVILEAVREVVNQVRQERKRDQPG